MASQKKRAHLLITDNYELALSASQWRDELREEAEERNREEGGENWRSERKEAAVVTVEFEVDDALFDPEPSPPVVSATIAAESKV